MFSFDNAEASVKRNIVTDDKSNLTATGKAYIGYLKQANPRYENIPQELLGKVFHFTTVPDADIKESDVLTIDTTEYTVRGVSVVTVRKLTFMRLHLVRSDD